MDAATHDIAATLVVVATISVRVAAAITVGTVAVISAVKSRAREAESEAYAGATPPVAAATPSATTEAAAVEASTMKPAAPEATACGCGCRRCKGNCRYCQETKYCFA
jgi:hypothetical protein